MAGKQIARMIGRRVLNKGIGKGISHASRGGKTQAEMTPEERRKAQHWEKQGRRAQKGLRMARRFLR